MPSHYLKDLEMDKNQKLLLKNKPTTFRERCEQSFNYTRILALVRDDWMCQGCGDTKHRLHVHHVNGREESDELWNLTTLCQVCHQEAHRKIECERAWQMTPKEYYERKEILDVIESSPPKGESRAS